jgi:hypothetical protein
MSPPIGGMGALFFPPFQWWYEHCPCHCPCPRGGGDQWIMKKKIILISKIFLITLVHPLVRRTMGIGKIVIFFLLFFFQWNTIVLIKNKKKYINKKRSSFASLCKSYRGTSIAQSMRTKTTCLRPK